MRRNPFVKQHKRSANQTSNQKKTYSWRIKLRRMSPPSILRAFVEGTATNSMTKIHLVNIVINARVSRWREISFSAHSLQNGKLMFGIRKSAIINLKCNKTRNESVFRLKVTYCKSKVSKSFYTRQK